MCFFYGTQVLMLPILSFDTREPRLRQSLKHCACAQALPHAAARPAAPVTAVIAACMLAAARAILPLATSTVCAVFWESQ